MLLFTNLKTVVTQLSHQFRLVPETSTSGRPRNISPIDAMTLALYQHRSTRATKKAAALHHHALGKKTPTPRKVHRRHRYPRVPQKECRPPSNHGSLYFTPSINQRLPR